MTTTEVDDSFTGNAVPVTTQQHTLSMCAREPDTTPLVVRDVGGE